MRFNQFEVVRLVNGFPADGIAPGTLAVVVDAREAADASGAGTSDAGTSGAGAADDDHTVVYHLEVHRPGLPLYTASATSEQVEALKTPGRRELWIMPEYDCHCFWATDGTTSGVHDNVAPDSLGLSHALVAEVQAWQDAYAATYVPDDPLASGFADAAAQEAFRRAGRALADRIAHELGERWTVVYRYGETDEF